MKRRRREWLRRLRVALRVMRGQRVFLDSKKSGGAITCNTRRLYA